jgi:hypothetical protein
MRRRAQPKPHFPTEGNEAKEELVFQRNANSNFIFPLRPSAENFFENRSTEGNEDTEDFQNQRLRPLFPSLPSVKILSDAKTQRLIEDKALIFHANQFLYCCWKSSAVQFAQHASLVDRLDQPWPFVPVDFVCRTDDFGAEFVRLLIKWMPRFCIRPAKHNSSAT